MSKKRTLKSPFLTTVEAARYLRSTERTMQNWRWAGIGPKYRKHVGTIVYHVDDLLKFSRVWNSSEDQSDAG